MKKDKPYPKILKIDALELKRNGLENYSFTSARFNITDNGESSIITSLGKHVVSWNFSKIKKGVLNDYKIIKTKETIFDNRFKYNSDEVLVTMENKVRLLKQKIN
jgi:hypothetical protein